MCASLKLPLCSNSVSGLINTTRTLKWIYNKVLSQIQATTNMLAGYCDIPVPNFVRSRANKVSTVAEHDERAEFPNSVSIVGYNYSRGIGWSGAKRQMVLRFTNYFERSVQSETTTIKRWVNFINLSNSKIVCTITKLCSIKNITSEHVYRISEVSETRGRPVSFLFITGR